MPAIGGCDVDDMGFIGVIMFANKAALAVVVVVVAAEAGAPAKSPNSFVGL